MSYQRELTQHLTALLRLWSSPRFRSSLVNTTGHDLNDTDARTLWELALRGPSRPGGLAIEMSLGAPALTKAVARLERSGLVGIARDPTDSRARVVDLTPEGRSVASELFEIGDRMIDKLTEGWAPSDIATLNDLLARLARNAVAFARGLEAIEPATHGTPRAGQAGPEG